MITTDEKYKELENKIENILRKIREFTKDLDHKELNDMVNRLGKLKNVIAA